MKILKIIGVVLLAAIIIFVAVVFMQPSHGYVQKSIVINAPVYRVFTEVNSFRNFTKWSPWSKMDPGATYTYDGMEGYGAQMNWNGEKLSKGSQRIVESVENKRVKADLVFDGYDGKAQAEFVLEQEGDNTKLMWLYEGENKGFGGKAMWVFMKGMLDDQYEQGLRDLKQMIEASPERQTEPAAISDTTTVAVQ